MKRIGLSFLCLSLLVSSCWNAPEIAFNPQNTVVNENITRVDINLAEAFCDASCKEEEFLPTDPAEELELLNDKELVVQTESPAAFQQLKSEFGEHFKQSDDLLGEKLQSAVLEAETAAQSKELWQELNQKDYVEQVEPNGFGEVNLPDLNSGETPTLSPLFQTAQAASDPILNFNLGDDHFESFFSGYGLAATQAADIWSVSKGKGVIVAVMDTGVDANHPDLKGRVLKGIDLINQDQDAHDDHFHGTHIAGIIAATAENGIGIAGVAPEAQILPIKVLDHNSGTKKGELQLALDTIARGIIWAVDHGARVVNLSLEAPEGSPLLLKAIRYAEKKRAVIVAAMGNNKRNKVRFPAAYAMLSNLIAVSAVQPDQKVWDGSNWGKWVSLAGPGYKIMSTLPTASTPAAQRLTDKTEDQLYGLSTGTSQAAPYVAGVAALLLSKNPNLSPQQVKHLLMKSAVDLGSKKGFDSNYGMGLVNAKQAMQLLADISSPKITTPPMVDIEGIIAQPFYIQAGDQVQLTLKHATTDQKLSYRWLSNGGRITGNTQTVTWQAPQQPGKYQIVVGVQQGQRKAFFRSQTLVH